MDPVLPTSANAISPAINALVADNPSRLEHINYGEGRWADVVAGWKAQAALNLRRVADEMLQARLPLASGQPLRALAASKFFANITDVSTKAIGQASIKDTLGSNLRGTVPKGTRFRRPANTHADPIPIQAAEYVSLIDVNVVADGVTEWLIPIECVSTGTAGNITVERYGIVPGFGAIIPGADLTIVDQIMGGPTFARFGVVSATCAGGGTSFTDDEVRRIAGAQPQGRRGPTDGAIYAGSYLATGVRHVALFTDTTRANTQLYVADASWASDVNYWQPAVIQMLLDDWAGFGCSLAPTGAGLVDNCYLNVAATVQLRSSRLLQSSAEVKAAITDKLQAYFNDRPDWYTFRASAIRGVIAQADPRVLTCTAVTLTDRLNNTIADPAPITVAPAILTHYDLLSFNPTFLAPV